MNRKSSVPEKKKRWKIFGNIMVIIAAGFVIRRFIDMGLDLRVFTPPRILTALFLAVANQTFTLCMGCFPWINFVEIFSGKSVPFPAAMTVYTKANIYKYVPGNVFQYVGKNRLAADMEINPVDVACSTILDVICGVIPLCIISMIMLGDYILTIMKGRWKGALVALAAGIIALILLFSIASVLKDRLADYFDRYRSVLSAGCRKKVLRVVVYYVAIALFSVAVNFIAAYLIFDETTSLRQLITVTGAYVFAWILGYITPGAPGGIGIRESAMLLVCGGISEENVIIYALLFRISSIISDMLGFLIGTVCEKRYHMV